MTTTELEHGFDDDDDDDDDACILGLMSAKVDANTHADRSNVVFM